MDEAMKVGMDEEALVFEAPDGYTGALTPIEETVIEQADALVRSVNWTRRQHRAVGLPAPEGIRSVNWTRSKKRAAGDPVAEAQIIEKVEGLFRSVNWTRRKK
ncbi:MAG: hypothetical protein NTU85_03435 [Candidatus Kaiserbacteria bacterium]|nr:hypothetical protein [Candidatus Kaiserbacteria bacterium]